MDALSIQSSTIADLRKDTKLWYKIQVFIYDLRNFREVPQSQERLDIIADASYIGMPYFTAAEAQTIKSTMVDTSKAEHPGKKIHKSQSQEDQQNLKRLEDVIENTLNERLERRIKKREESGDFRVCAAHDLAPILEKAFGINPKDLARDKEFLEVMEKSGLELKDGEAWKELSKKVGRKKKGKH